MDLAQYYCTVAEVVADLDLRGDADVLPHIASACEHIKNQLGFWIPVTEVRKFPAADVVYTDPLISITSIQDAGGNAITDYTLLPYNKHWIDGCYTRIQLNQAPAGDYVQVTGKWAKIQRLAPFGAIASATLTANATTLLVTDGSQVSAGMVLLCETEQVLVQGFTSTITAATTLVGALDESAEEATLAAASQVKLGEIIKIDFEQARVLDISGNAVRLARGWNKTQRSAHNDGASVGVFRTIQLLRGVNGTTAAAHTTQPMQQLVAPDDVNYLARQVAGLMRAKAQSGWGGKQGGSDLGEIFFINEFPRQIQTIRNNYRIH